MSLSRVISSCGNYFSKKGMAFRARESGEHQSPVFAHTFWTYFTAAGVRPIICPDLTMVIFKTRIYTPANLNFRRAFFGARLDA
jgi:hypothetical protein